MGDLRLEAIRSNIARIEDRLESETDELKRDDLCRLLAEARAEALFLEEDMNLWQGEVPPPGAAQRWRVKAAEYCALAEGAHGDTAGHAYQRLAAGYAKMAEKAEELSCNGAVPWKTPLPTA